MVFIVPVILYVKDGEFYNSVDSSFKIVSKRYFSEAGQVLNHLISMGWQRPIWLLVPTWRKQFNKFLMWVEGAGIGILLSVLFELPTTTRREPLNICIQYVDFRC